MSNRKYRAIPDPRPDVDSLRDAVAATKETVEVLTRQRRPITAAAVTWQDLLDLGLITADKVPLR